MATTPPVTPTPTPAKPNAFLTFLSDFPGVTFIKAHEKLIIIVIVAMLGLHFWNTGLNAWQQHENKQVAALQAKDASDAAATKAAQDQDAADKAQAATDKAQLTQLVNIVTTQNAALNQDIITRDKQTQNQQQQDLHSTIPQLSQRFASLVPGVDPTDIKIAADGLTVTVGTDTAQKTVAQLELVPQLQSDLKDTKQEVTNLQSEITSLQTYNKALETEVAAQDKTIALLQTELTDAGKTCDARVAVEKTKAKKSFMRGLKIGAILGFFAGLFGAHAAGI